MATKVQRIKVGVFIVVGAALFIGGALSMTGYSRALQTSFWMEFHDSVLGLNVGAVVEYLGVPVGQVTGIRVTEQNVARVDIIVEDEQVVLRDGVEAQLVLISLATGVMYIHLEGGTPEDPLLPPGYKIPVQPALMSSLMTDMGDMLPRVKDILQQVNLALEGMESGDVTRIIHKVETLADDADVMLVKMTDTMDKLSEGAELTMADARTVMAQAGATADSATTLIETFQGKIDPVDIAATNDQLQALLKNMNDTTGDLRTTLAGATESMGAVVHKAGNIEYSVRESLRAAVETLDSIRDLAEFLRQDPSALLRGAGAPNEGL